MLEEEGEIDDTLRKRGIWWDSGGGNKGKSSVVQTKRVDTSHLRQADVIKTEGEGRQEYDETGAVVRCRDVATKETVASNCCPSILKS